MDKVIIVCRRLDESMIISLLYLQRVIRI